MQERRIVVEVSNPYLDARAKQARDDATVGIVFFICVVTGSILYGIFSLINSWQTFEAPYKYALAFYYYSIGFSVYSFVCVWDWLINLQPTPYRNLNGIMAMVAMAIYSLFMVFGFVPWVLGWLLRKLKLTWRGGLALFLAPGLLALVWYVIAGVFGWLFAKG